MIKKNSLTFLLLFIFLFSIAMAADEAMKSGASRMEMSDSKRYDPPLPVSQIGTKLDGQVNFMTCAWFTRVEIDPYMFGISIQKQHFTHKAIMENRCFRSVQIFRQRIIKNSSSKTDNLSSHIENSK